LLTIPGALLLPNLSGIIFELYWPKLHWDNEQKAVKQNMNVLYGMVAALIFAGMAIAPVLVFELTLPVAAVILVGLPSFAVRHPHDHAAPPDSGSNASTITMNSKITVANL